MDNQQCTWVVVGKKNETHDVVSLTLQAQSKRPTFIAGQYLTVYRNEDDHGHGKCYSIASAPHDEFITLTIKSMGEFSNALCALPIGSTLITSLPYGFFYPEIENQSFVFVTGGIGITPCYSIIQDLLIHEYPQDITLYYSNKTIHDVVYKDALDNLARAHQNFTVHYFFTQEKLDSALPHLGRMDGCIITSLLKDNESATDFFICGSIDFTKSLWTSLKNSGIHDRNLYTEGFF